MKPIAIPEQARLRLRSLLENSPNVFALDAVEVRPPSAPDAPIVLSLQFLRPAPGVDRAIVPPGLGMANIRLDPLTPESAPLSVRSIRTLGHSVELHLSDNAARVGQYRVELRGVEGLSPYFVSADISLGGEAQAPWPTVETVAYQPASPLPPPANYLAKDYASFLTIIQDQMALAAPQWTERHPADIGVMITETLAYVADQLSYYQDAVATEAYLGTARLRTSVARHARLHGIRVRQPVAPRTWVLFEVEGEATLPIGSLLSSYMTGMPTRVSVAALEDRLRYANTKHVFFETLYDAPLSERFNRIPLHTWGMARTELPVSATEVVLVGSFSELAAGQLLVFHSDDPAAPACCVRLNRQPRLFTDPLTGVALTEVGWHSEDALASAMTVKAGGDGVAPTVACGNVVLAEQGRTLYAAALPTPRPGLPYRPALPEPNLVFHAPWNPDRFVAEPATLALQTVSKDAVPAALVTETDTRTPPSSQQPFFGHRNPPSSGEKLWRGIADILKARVSERVFIAETEQDSTVTLRFGDGKRGRVPHAGAHLFADYRVAELQGLSRGLLLHLIDPAVPVLRVTNPFAVAPVDIETLEHIRLLAPTSSRLRTSCILPADYATYLEREPEVLQAIAHARTPRLMQCHVLLRGGVTFTPELRDRLEQTLIAHARMGVAVQVLPATNLPLEAEVTLLHRAAEERSIAQAARIALAGFFAPKRNSIGKSLYASELVEHLQTLHLVEAVTVERFRELGGSQAAVMAVLQPPATGVVVMRNDPRRPSLGTLRLNFHQAPRHGGSAVRRGNA